MRTYRSVLKMVLVLGLVAGITSPAAAFLGNKFEKEVEKETGAVNWSVKFSVADMMWLPPKS